MNEIIVSFDNVKVKEFRAYLVAVAKHDWVGQDAFFAKVIQSWPYTLEPNNPSSYGELKLADYLQVQQSIYLKSLDLAKLLKVISADQKAISQLSRL